MSFDKRSNISLGELQDRSLNTPGSPGGGRKTLVLAALAVCLVGGLVAYFIFGAKSGQKTVGSEQNSKQEAAALTVSVKPAGYQNVHRRLSVNGSVWAWDPLQIGSEVTMLRVESVEVEEGDDVRKGQVLARLNSSILRAQLAQEKAKLQASEALLRKSIQPNRIEDLNTWRAALSQAEANLAQEEAFLLRVKANAANVKENARRFQELRKVGAVSQMDADAKATEAKTSSAEVAAAEKKADAMKYALHQAKEKLAMAERGGRSEDIAISKAGLEETRARIRQLEAQIEQTIIKAPDDGKIVKREVHLGEIPGAGKTMFSMVRNNKLELRALVPELDLSRVKAGMKVKLSATHNGETLEGRVREVSPAVDDKSRLGTARIDIENSAALKPGLFYHAEIDLGSDRALVVPIRSVLNRNDEEIVFVYENGKARKRKVVIGEPLADDMMEIRSGLKENEQVIVSGAGFMKDDDPVRVAPEPGKPEKN